MVQRVPPFFANDTNILQVQSERSAFEIRKRRPKNSQATSQSNRKSQIDWKSSSEPSNHMRFQWISKAGGSIELLNNKHSACPGKRECVFFLSREHQTSNIKSGILLFHLILESDYIYTPVKSNPPPQAVFATLSEQILIWKLEKENG